MQQQRPNTAKNKLINLNKKKVKEAKEILGKLFKKKTKHIHIKALVPSVPTLQSSRFTLRKSTA